MYMATSLPTELYPQLLMAHFKYLFILFYLHIYVCVPAHVYVHNMYLNPSETRVTSYRPPCELGTPTPALCKYNKCSIFAAEISLRPHPLYGSFLM